MLQLSRPDVCDVVSTSTQYVPYTDFSPPPLLYLDIDAHAPPHLVHIVACTYIYLRIRGARKVTSCVFRLLYTYSVDLLFHSFLLEHEQDQRTCVHIIIQSFGLLAISDVPDLHTLRV